MKLNAGQRAAVDAIAAGKNVFITGEGGAGKSVALREAVRALEAAGRSVVVCAPTGIAALQVGGSTIHSAFRFGFGPKVGQKTLGELDPSEVVTHADVVIIDEIGMVRRDMMDAISVVIGKANELRKRRKEDPVQVVLVGDFSQLPPVITDEDKEVLDAWYGDDPGRWAFQAEGWNALGLECHMLTEPMRQADPVFVQMLNRARAGDASCIPYFNALANRGATPADAVSIVGTNRAAAAANKARLASIKSPLVTFNGRVEGKMPKRELPAPEKLELKVGARVIITANDTESRRYVNGSTGVVTDLNSLDAQLRPCVEVLLDNGKKVLVAKTTWEQIKYRLTPGSRVEPEVIGRYTQYPLKLGWAVTYHKSQGQTLAKIVLNPKTFANGQLYVGLSRATSPASIWLTQEIRPEDLLADQKVVEFYRKLGWVPPTPATGDERPALPAAKEEEAGKKEEEKEATEPETLVQKKDEGKEERPLPTTMDAIMDELVQLLSAGGRAWSRVYELMDTVATNELYKPSFRSYTAWVNALARQSGVTAGLLWHRKSAGDWYKEYRGSHPEAPSLEQGAGLSEENLNLIRKIATMAPNRTDELMTSVMSGDIGTKSLRAAWRDVRQARKQEQEGGNAPSEDTVPSSPVVTDADTMTVTVSDAATWTAVLAALRTAGLL